MNSSSLLPPAHLRIQLAHPYSTGLARLPVVRRCLRPAQFLLIVALWLSLGQIALAQTGALATRQFRFDRAIGLAISPDGSQIAVAGDVGVQLLEFSTLQRVGYITGHQDSVESVDYSPDGNYLATAGWDGVAKTWDARTHVLIHTLAGHTALVHSAIFSPDGLTLLTSSWDHTVKLWETASGQCIRTFPGDDDVIEYASFSPDGTKILSCGYDNLARIWDARSGSLLQTLSGHTDGIQTAVFFNDGTQVLTGSFDGTARLWDAATGSQTHVFRGHLSGIHSAIFSPYGTRIVTASWDNTAKVWNAATGELQTTLRGHARVVLYALFSPDQSTILTASGDGTVRKWDAYTGRQIQVAELGRDFVRSTAISPDGKHAAFGLDNGNVAIVDSETSTLQHLLCPGTSPVIALEYDPTGERLLSRASDGKAACIDPEKSSIQFHLDDAQTTVTAAACFADGKSLVAAMSDGTLRIWSMASGAQSKSFPTHEAQIRAVHLLGSPLSVATVTQSGEVSLWDLNDGRQISRVSTRVPDATAVAFSPDGGTLLMGRPDGSVVDWNVATATRRRVLRGLHKPVRNIAITPSGRVALAGAKDGRICFWNLPGGSRYHTIDGDSAITALACAAGSFISVGRDGVAGQFPLPHHVLLGQMLLRLVAGMTLLALAILSVWWLRRRRPRSLVSRPAKAPPAPPRRPTRGRIAIFRILAVFLGLLVAVPFAEVATRLWLTWNYEGTLDYLPARDPGPDSTDVRLGDIVKVDPDPYLGYRLRPNLDTYFRGQRLATSAQGFRDDLVTTRTPRTLRVLGLGDSTMFGFGVPRTATYMEVLEDEFRSLLGSQWNVDFINSAVPGYNTVQELAVLKGSGLAMDPDAVIVQFDLNDFQVPVNYVRPDFLFARFFFLAHPLFLSNGTFASPETFYMLNQVDRLYNTPSPYGGKQPLIEAYREIASLCHERGIPVFGVFLFRDYPIDGDIRGADARYQNIERLWRQLGIIPIETAPNAQAYLQTRHLDSWQILETQPDDPHPNTIGHALMAQAILPVLMKTLLPKLHLNPTALPGYPTVGNIALRQITASGLHQTERWDGHPVNWSTGQAGFDFVPAGRRLLLSFVSSYPKISTHFPVYARLRIMGVPTPQHPAPRIDQTFPIFQQGYFTRTVDLGDLAGVPLHLSLSVNRTFHTESDPRELGLAIYDLKFEN